MDNLHVDVVRGNRCVLVLVTESGRKISHYEYEQDSDLIISARDGLAKWENGDGNFRLPNDTEP